MPDTITDLGQLALGNAVLSQFISNRFAPPFSIASVNLGGQYIPILRPDMTAKTTPAGRHSTKYPTALIRWFAGGLIVLMIGLVMLLASAFVQVDALTFAAAILLAAGSCVVAVTLLRGQDIDERAL